MIEFVRAFAGNVYSQNGEDKIIEEILRRLEITKGHAVEIGANNGTYCSNTAHLLDQGWSGTLVESDFGLFRQCKERWKKRLDVLCQCSSVNAQNINAFVTDQCDVFSTDTDGDDYKIFEGLEAKPKVVIVEIDSSHPPDVEVFNSDGGASYATMVKLGMSKGYRLLCHTGNLIFIDKQYKDLFSEIKGYHPLIESELYFNRGWLSEEVRAQIADTAREVGAKGDGL